MRRAAFLLCAMLCVTCPGLPWIAGQAQQTGGGGVPGGTVNATSLHGTPVSPTTPTSNQVLQDIGGIWTPETLSAGSGTVSTGSQYALSAYTTNPTGSTVGATNITTDSSGNNLNVPGTVTGLTTPLSTAQGGTGAGALTGIRQANGASADTVATSAQVQAGAAYSSVPIRPVFLSVFGDSYMAGIGVSNPAQDFAQGFLPASTEAPYINHAVSGTTAPQITANIFANFAPDVNLSGVVVWNGGQNDDNYDTCGGTTTSGCAYNFIQSIDAGIAWSVIPYNFRQYASTASASGSWTADTTLPIYSNTLLSSPGTPMQSSTSGNTLTFSIPSSASTVIGLTYEVANTYAGTFTVSIDGTLQTDGYSQTTTFNSAPNAGKALANATVGFFRQEFTVTSGTTHTVVVSNAASSKISIVSVDWAPPANTPNENTLFAIGPNPYFTYAANYNSMFSSTVAGEAAVGLPVVFVSQLLGTPGVNSSTDVATSATATCSASALAGHPNTCGQLHLYQTFRNAEIASGHVFENYNGAPWPANLFAGSNNVLGIYNNLGLFGAFTITEGSFPVFTLGAANGNTPLGLSGKISTQIGVPTVSIGNGTNFVGTSAGNHLILNIGEFFNPSSGSSNFFGTVINPNIDQTGSASGSYTGLGVFPQVTNALGTGNYLFRAGFASSSFANSTPTLTDKLDIDTAGDVIPALGAMYETTHGSNGTSGVVTLASGTATVSTTAIAVLAAAGAAGDVVNLVLQSCSNCGTLSVGTVSAGSSFVINSTSGSDASNVYWEIRKIN
jgi:hypothetical protein